MLFKWTYNFDNATSSLEQKLKGINVDFNLLHHIDLITECVFFDRNEFLEFCEISLTMYFLWKKMPNIILVEFVNQYLQFLYCNDKKNPEYLSFKARMFLIIPINWVFWRHELVIVWQIALGKKK